MSGEPAPAEPRCERHPGSPGMAVVGLGQLGGVADGIAFALQKSRRGKQQRNGKKMLGVKAGVHLITDQIRNAQAARKGCGEASWPQQGPEGSRRGPQRCTALHASAPTSGLNPLVKSFMRLSVGPRSTLLQFKRTLSRAWVAQELGISWGATQGPVSSRNSATV